MNNREMIAAVLLVVDTATAAVNSVVDGVTDLIQTPVLLASALQNMVSTVVDGVSSVGEAFVSVSEFFGGEDALPAEGNIIAKRSQVDALSKCIADLAVVNSEIPAVEAGEAQQSAIKQANRDAFVQHMKATSIASVSATAVQLEYESFDQAQQMREDITALIDDLLTDTGLTDAVYGPLVDLRAALADHFATVAAELPELTEYTPQAQLPALVLAYQIYGDADREVDILSRNLSLRDPTAIPAGQAIQVLVDV